MAKVIGVGGVFFKAQDPEAVRAWYARVLGVEFASWGGTHWTNAPDSVSVLTLFKPDTDKFNPSTQPFMLNLIVEDLDGLLAKAKAAGETPAGGRGLRLRQIRLADGSRGREGGTLGTQIAARSAIKIGRGDR
jgi:hypothetical protein